MLAHDFAKLEVMNTLIVFTLSLIAFAANAEIVEFKLQSGDAACKGPSQVVISQDKTLLYQMDAPSSGTGQVHLLTGTFQIEAKNKAGCSFQDVIQISDLPNKVISVKLEKSTRKPTEAESVTAASYPCRWGNFGCDGNNYAHGGNIAMNRQSIYLAGKDEGRFTLRFTGESYNFLAAMPAFKDKELSGELRKGSIYSDNIWYPKLSFDARASDEFLQSAMGFCCNRKEIHQFMLEGMVKYQFPNEARIDFVDYSKKIPQAARYCVFPQVNAQLDKAAPLELNYEDKTQVRTERLFYLIVPQDHLGKRIPAKEHRFSDKPKSLWKHYSRTVFPKTAYLYEWGVGYMFE